MTKASRTTLRQWAQQWRHVHCALDHLLPSFILPRIKAEPDQAVHAWQENLNYRVHAAAVIMASSEGADCQKQLRVLRVCKKRGELCWQHIIYTTVSTSSSKWEREVAWGIACGSCDLILRGSGPFVNESRSDVLNVWIPNRIANFSRKGLLPESLWLL